MRIGGFVTCSHDASVSIINQDGDIEFASGSERFTRKKYDRILSKTLIDKLIDSEVQVFFEDYSTKFWERQKTLHWSRIVKRLPDDEKVSSETLKMFNDPESITSFLAQHKPHHHVSHAAASFYTRPWQSHDDTVMLSVDGFGSDTWVSSAIYTYDEATNEFVQKFKSGRSIGNLYSDITWFLGYSDHEAGTVMGLSAMGVPKYESLVEQIFEQVVPDMVEEADKDFLSQYSLHKLNKSCRQNLQNLLQEKIDKSHPKWREDLAASLQKVAETKIKALAEIARKYGSKLCYAGGVAQNIIANSKIKDMFDDVWIASDPTDAGSSLGAAAWFWGKEFGRTNINWLDAYLGYNITRSINPKEVVDYLLENKVCGVANGQAEFGPRALGNRSLIGDVRYDIKDTVNGIKKREKFRPFGPLILEEEFDKWFEGHTNGYMQYICKPKHDLNSVIHIDGTSRVQTVPPHSRSIIRPILEEYFERTGMPMLLNTSLNIKGQPMVNNEHDAVNFEKKYKVKVF